MSAAKLPAVLRFLPDEDELLIDFVQNHAILYDLKDPEFKNTLKKSIPNFSELLANMMLPSEEMSIVTEDGYILTMFRIPRKGATPVLFVHGFMGCSDMWLLTNRKNNIPTVFYDQGYDVWLMNQRGNVYSKRHITQSSASDNPFFWNFSFHEIGLYDLSASINRILEITGQKKLLYVGHSMAAAALISLCSQRPEYNQKIRAAALLAPVAYSMRESKVPVLGLFVNQASFFANLLYQVSLYEFLPFDDTRAKITYSLCAARVSLCGVALKLLFHTNVKNYIQEEVPLYLARLTAGTSVKNYEHLGYIVSPGNDFTQYNYGPDTNVLHYGSATPPKYNVSQVTVPLALLYSVSDPFLDDFSIAQLKASVPNIILDVKITDPTFQHLDYLYGISARKMVTDLVLKAFKRFQDGRHSVHPPTHFNTIRKKMSTVDRLMAIRPRRWNTLIW